MAKSFKKLVKKTATAKSKKIAKERTKKLLSEINDHQKMIERYGTSVNWARADIHLTYKEMIEYFGEQCEEFEPLCENCINWVQWHKTGTANIMFERDKFMDQILKGNL